MDVIVLMMKIEVIWSTICINAQLAIQFLHLLHVQFALAVQIFEFLKT